MKALMKTLLGPTRIGALAIIGALSGCQQANEPEDGLQPAVEASPDAKPGMELTDVRLVLPAVSGNPGAAYFVVNNGGENGATLAGVHIDGVGKTEIHETSGGSMRKLERLEIAPDGSAVFEPGGKHVMAFDISDEMKAGGVTEMTLTFADGDKISMAATIESAGGAMPMGGMEN